MMAMATPATSLSTRWLSVEMSMRRDTGRTTVTQGELREILNSFCNMLARELRLIDSLSCIAAEVMS